MLRLKRSLLYCAVCLGGANLSQAQTPDVIVKLDSTLQYRTSPEGESTLRWYDSQGRLSVVSLGFTLEPGFAVYFSQRLQRIRGNGDPEMLDEYYIEDKDYWRVGKQYLPFGGQRIIRESVNAAKVRTSLGADALQLDIAWCDANDGRQRGIIGRLGTRVGISFALGEHFGISQTSLLNLREIGTYQGKGKGYQQMFGLDVSKKIGKLDGRAELVLLRKGEGSEDEDREITDITLTANPDRFRSASVGWVRDWSQTTNTWLLSGSFLVENNAWIEPVLRYRDGKVWDFGVALRLRL